MVRDGNEPRGIGARLDIAAEDHRARATSAPRRARRPGRWSRPVGPEAHGVGR